MRQKLLLLTATKSQSHTYTSFLVSTGASFNDRNARRTHHCTGIYCSVFDSTLCKLFSTYT